MPDLAPPDPQNREHALGQVFSDSFSRDLSRGSARAWWGRMIRASDGVLHVAPRFLANDPLGSREGTFLQGDTVGGPIRWRLHVQAAPEKVFAALDTDDGRASFWAESAVETEGYIAFRHSNGFSFRSRILEREAPRLFALDYFGSPARFELTPDGEGRTVLLLTHEGVRAEEWIEVHAGWLTVLFPLKAWVGHAVNLRNQTPGRSWDEGYADG